MLQSMLSTSMSNDETERLSGVLSERVEFELSSHERVIRGTGVALTVETNTIKITSKTRRY